MVLQNGRIYLVQHEIKGTFLMEVQTSDEIFTVGKILRRKSDLIETDRPVCETELIKVRNNLSTFQLAGDLNKEKTTKGRG